MTHESESLIETGQMDLIPSTEIQNDALVAAESGSEFRNPEFTAARFYKHQPQLYREIVSLRAEQVPIAAVARLYNVSRQTVAAIDKRELNTRSVEQLKTGAAKGYRYLAALGRERLEELILAVRAENLKPAELAAVTRALAVAVGVAEDKAQLLSGAPTQRLDLGTSRPGHQELVEALKDLKDDYDRRMRLEGENPPQKGDPRDVTADVQLDPGPGDGPPGPETAGDEQVEAACGSGAGGHTPTPTDTTDTPNSPGAAAQEGG